MRKLVTAFVLVPLLIVLVMFAVANRQLVTISFDPFDSENPAYALKAPLFIVMFALIAGGAPESRRCGGDAAAAATYGGQQRRGFARQLGELADELQLKPLRAALTCRASA